MHNYKAQLRRESQHDHTPTKSSWDREKDQIPLSRNDNKYDYKYDPKHEDRYDSKYQTKQAKFQTKYDKSQLSYYQSHSSKVVYDYERSQRPSNRSQAQNFQQKYIFNQIMIVRIRSFQREESETRLRIQIQIKNEKGSSIIFINLTDDSNPKFLWIFSIRESDFMNLKNEQKLKVNFGNFPQMLQNCFKQCQGEIYSQQRKNHLQLEMRKGGEGKLSILETNRYKQSTHLELQFKMANDEQIKEHLSNKLIFSQEEISKNRSQISYMEDTLAERMRENEELRMYLKDFKSQREKQTEDLRLKQKQKLNQLQSAHLTKLTMIMKEKQTQAKQLKFRYESQIQNLIKQRQKRKIQLETAKEKIMNYESSQRQLKMKVTIQEQELKSRRVQSEQLRKDNVSLTNSKFQNQKKIAELNCKIESLYNQLTDKKQLIKSTVQLKQTNNSKISSLQQQILDEKRKTTKLESKVNELDSQIKRLNHQNSQFSQKNMRAKERNHQYGQIIKDQQKQINSFKQLQLDLKRQNRDLTLQNSQRQKNMLKLQQSYDMIQKKLQDQMDFASYLQKSLNEKPAIRSISSYNQGSSYQPVMPPYSGLNRQLPSPISTSSVNSSRINTTMGSVVGNNNIDLNKDRLDKYQPTIKRYEEREDRSKSPLPKRLAQQREPEEEEGSVVEKTSSFDQPKPVKFKMAQPRQRNN